MATPASVAVIQTVPLAHLFLAPENVRTTPPSKSADAELKASVYNHGLLENLVVREAGSAKDGNPRFAVLAGGRRLSVLTELAAEDKIPADHPIPCIVASSDTPAEEISLAENTVRLPMHPADQVTAFSKLLNSGAGVSEVATRFGVSQRLVKQRMRLGNIAPEIIQAYRDERLDMETLQAFSLTTDHARQMAVWEQLSGMGYRANSYQVERLLTAERVPSSAGVATFVGVNPYKAAGGTFLRDLFSTNSNTWLDNPDLLNELAMKKLTGEADRLAGDWSWVVPMIEVDWQTTAEFGHVHPVPDAPTDDEQAAMASHQQRMIEIEAIAEEDWTDELAEELAINHAEIARIEDEIAQRTSYSDEDRAIAGCIVTIARDGSLRVIPGLVRPEDIPEQDITSGAANDSEHVALPAIRDIDPRARARKTSGMGIGLADDMRAIRTAIVKKHLQEDFNAAFDLLAFQLARSVFTDGYNYRPRALDISASATPDQPRVNDEHFPVWNPASVELEDVSHLPFDWMAQPDSPTCFEAFRALPEDDRKTLFAAAVARTLKGQLAFEYDALPEFEATVARLDIDFASQVRPTADMFWSRINKSQVLDIAGDTLGTDWANNHAKQKKTELAEAMETAFAAGTLPIGVSAGGHAAALGWAPPGFVAFDGATDPSTETPDENGSTTTLHAVNGDAAANDDIAPEPEVPEFLRNVS